MLSKILLIVAMGMSFTTVAGDNVPITPAECKDRPVSSTPALIEEGRRLFKKETFNGNGRTCETCHRENRNFTIDPEFIAILPGDDPLFVAEFNAALRDLENSEMMRRFGLILINIDGFDKPGVLRSAPHLLGLSQTTALGISELVEDELKPVHETGWSADGAPGDGSLRCFPVGSVIQHFTKRMDRVNGDDFRLPTEHELDALLVYMLAQGRQSTPMVSSLTFSDPAAERGKTLFFGDIPVRNPNNTGTNNCSQCHEQAGANNRSNFVARNRVINANLSPNAPICRAIALNPSLDIPADGGFGIVEYDDTIACSTGDVEVRLYSEQVQNPRGFFNTPSLHESADTGPYFHNNSAETLEDAIRFYSSDTFNDSGNDIAFVFGPTDVNDISAFLRAINAIENARSAIDYIDKALASSGEKIDAKPLKLALADSNDGIKVLTTGPLPSLFPEAVNLFHDANEFLNVAIDSKDRVAAGHAKQKLATVSVTVVNTTPLPDVIVTSVSYADGIFTSTVTNQGTAATPVGKVIGVGYSVNGNFRTWGAVAGPLAVGASVTIGTNGGSYIIPNGTHTIMADVDDVNRFTESNETNNQLSQLVIVDGGTNPTVSITAPTGGVNVAGSSVTISASAADDIGVSGVQFKLDGTNLGAEVTTPPYAVTWDSTAVSDGPHTITAVARDADGNTTTSAGVSVTVANTMLLPDVIVTSISYADGIFTSTVTNQGTAATPVGKVIGVGYSVNGNFRTWGAVAGPLAVGASVTIGTNGGPYIIPNGTHTITADVDDVNRFTESNETNNQLSQPVIVDGGTSPTVFITAPTGGVNVAGSSVTISASATDDIGVSGVQFKLDGTNLGTEVTTPPYAVTWDSTVVDDGPHTITAVARDADGNTITSAGVSVTVANTTPLPDVIVTSISYADGIFTSTVTNQGTAATPVGTVIGVGYSVNGNFRTWGAVAGPLAVGASVTIGTKGGPYIIPSGTHTITADVDDVNRFAESNEANNQLSQPVSVP